MCFLIIIIIGLLFIIIIYLIEYIFLKFKPNLFVIMTSSFSDSFAAGVDDFIKSVPYTGWLEFILHVGLEHQKAGNKLVSDEFRAELLWSVARADANKSL